MQQINKRADTSIDGFSSNPEQSFTMPARIYFDPGFLEDEKRQVFWKSWIFAGHVSDLQNPGDYITTEFCGQRLFVIRATNGELSAYFNVCQHRGHSLLRGKGSANKRIVCPYHAWAYDHQGQLLHARNCEKVSGFEKTDFDLPEIHVEDFCGFVFVNLDPNARPMSEVYTGAADMLRSFCPDIDKLTPGPNTPFDIKGNWKNVGDNLLECYHCHPAHHAFVDLVKMKTYQVETHKYWSVQYGHCKPDNTAYAFADSVEDDRFATLYMWPNMAFTRLPGTEGINVFTFFPLTAELTHQDFIYYSPTTDITATEQAAMDYFAEVLGPEDVNLVEDVQQGLNSLGYHQGRIMVDPERSEISEHALHHFQNLVMQEMRDFV
ncbi:MAG: aromatic ring-hydroxylating oxygenase subunit alpha [Thiolinea sp.]